MRWREAQHAKKAILGFLVFDKTPLGRKVEMCWIKLPGSATSMVLWLDDDGEELSREEAGQG